MDELSVFMEADTCSSLIFHMSDIARCISFPVSRFFVDVDRSPKQLSGGIVKRFDLHGRPVLLQNCFPDDIALSAIWKRYWSPFHSKAEDIIEEGGIELILSCHTVMPIGPRAAYDEGLPRPVLSVHNKVETEDGSLLVTCPDETAQALLSSIETSFGTEDYGMEKPFVVSPRPATGYIMEKYGISGIPTLKLRLSKSLFLNEKYFKKDLHIDEGRIEELRGRMREALKNFARRFFRHA